MDMLLHDHCLENPPNKRIRITNNHSFVSEVDDLVDYINDCCDWVKNNDIEMLRNALNNSLFKRYLKSNLDFQIDLFAAIFDNVDKGLNPEISNLIKSCIPKNIFKFFHCNEAEEYLRLVEILHKQKRGYDISTLYVKEVHTLFENIEHCVEWIKDNNVENVKGAFKNSLFKRYVKCNKEFQMDLLQVAFEVQKLDVKIWKLLKNCIPKQF
jgi:phage tail tube protein FII